MNHDGQRGYESACWATPSHHNHASLIEWE